MWQRMRRPSRGVTLLELVVVIAVLGLLAALAIPSYLDQVRKGRRADGKALLLETAARMEQFFTENNRYTISFAELNLPAGATSQEGHYLLAVTAPDAACPIAGCFSLEAQPLGGQTADSCGTLTLTSSGTRGADGGADCW
jgi:type IV pilus assembly protein PilE